MQKFLPVIIIILIAFGAYYFLRQNNLLPGNQSSSPPIALPQGSVCDSETMTCSDGTILYKQGPDCTFPPCPSSSASSSMMPGSSKITISGTMICLPHKNTNGPQTLECALGLKGDDGNNYGLNDPGWKYLIGVGNGSEVEITGKLIKKQDQKYNSAGIIEIESLVKNEE